MIDKDSLRELLIDVLGNHINDDEEGVEAIAGDIIERMDEEGFLDDGQTP